MIKLINRYLLFFSFFLAACLSFNTFAQENNPHGKDFSIDCMKCHTTDNWKVDLDKVNFNHAETGFPLNGQHSILLCSDCHTSLKFKKVSTDCFSCHIDAHKNTLGLDCIKCHNTESWKQVNMVQIHDQFRFPLIGVHRIEECELCHNNSKNFIFSGASLNCFDCHRKDYNKTSNPQHVLLGMSTNCDECHTINSFNWTAERFRHVQLSFAGAHVSLTCNQCHNSEHLGYTQECYACHKSDYEKAADPPHYSNNFPHECSTCHNTDTWVGAQFNHDATTFPLTGSHKNAQCKSCHISGYSGTSTQCFSCHQVNYNTAPQHLALSYPHSCEMCHNTTAWNQTNFDHNSTGFQLTGSHINTDCNSCHKTGFIGTPTQCFSCHESSFNQAPDHVAKGYPHTCEMCHNTTTWNQISFNHSSTGFQLTGSHISTACNSCHKTGFPGTPTQCFSCHESSFNQASDHVAKGYPHTCEMCHNTAAWNQTNFDHNSTGFQLTGSHLNTDCNSCHSQGFQGTSPLCFSCHETSFNQAPDHLSKNYPHTCEMYHNTTSWDQTNFNHSSTGFQLTGSHLNADCNSCHKNGYQGTSPLCFSCHETAFNQAPDHIAKAYPHTCELCHNTNVWNQVSFDHSTTGFALTGAHINVNCSDCHASGFTGTSALCESCHMDNYNSAVNPSHKNLNLPVNCSQCHTTNTGWSPAQFPIHDNYFTFAGAHINIKDNCSICHNDNYNNTPNTCFGCHQNNYNGTTNPPHLSLGFPQTCSDCHTQTGWSPASYNHDGSYFPIYSGRHSGVWSKCSDCHTSSSNYQIFSCINCHEHNKTETDGHHTEVSGYSYNSSECYRCHPKGRSEGVSNLFQRNRTNVR